MQRIKTSIERLEVLIESGSKLPIQLQAILRILNYPQVKLSESLINLSAEQNEQIQELLTCPRTKKIFYLPFQLKNCGHVVERETYVKYFQTHQNDCPCCHAEVGAMLVSERNLLFSQGARVARLRQETMQPTLVEGEDMFMSEPMVLLINMMITLDPSILETQFISTKIVFDIMQDTNPVSRNWLANRLSDRFLLNIAKRTQLVDSEVDEFFDTSFLYQILCCENGGRFLQENMSVRDSITVEGLNTACVGPPHIGATPLLRITALHMHLLIDDLALRSKITSEGLNTSSDSAYSCLGDSPLIHLTGKPQGRKLLLEDAALRAKVTAAGLLLVSTKGQNKDRCPLSFLLPPENRALLTLLVEENDELRAELHEKISTADQAHFNLEELLKPKQASAIAARK